MPGPFARPGVANVQYIAPGANRAGWVLTLGLALIAANAWRNQTEQTLFKGLFDVGVAMSLSSAKDGGAVKQAVLDLFFQGVMLTILVGIAAASDAAGTLALLFVAGLWIMFLINGPQPFAESGSGGPLGGKKSGKTA